MLNAPDVVHGCFKPYTLPCIVALFSFVQQNTIEFEFQTFTRIYTLGVYQFKLLSIIIYQETKHS